MKQLLTVDEVAQLLGVHRATIYRWAETGVLPAIKVGSALLRFDPDVLQDWLRTTPAERERQARASKPGGAR
ncbi:MAG TPA: helix-turn-helix domain-containing protein [Actinomycetota bacterium]|nr:helix-turn-helix domain-containing protein [Actinomycetota bacterium]